MNTEKLTRLTRALDGIRARYKVKRQGDVAELLGVNRSALSAAVNGNERYLTESLVHKAEMLAGPVAPGAAAQAEPDIVIPAATAKMYADMAESIRILSELVAAQQKGAGKESPAASGF